MRTIALFALAAFVTFGQQKAARKEFKPPEFRMFDPLVAKDEGCAKDLAKIPAMEGLAQRKHLSELITYGCVKYSSGPHMVTILGFREFADGAKKIQVRRAHLLSMDSLETLDGWVLADGIISLDTIRLVMKALRIAEPEPPQ